MSYYATLGLDRSATTEDVKRTYRKCALKWHPERCDFAEAEATFQAVAESYDVLSHPARRAIYDQYGQHGLKEGIPDGNGGIKGGTYTFSKNAHEIFAAFFGTSSPFSDILGDMGDEAPPFYGELTGMTLPKKPTKPEPLRLSLAVTLLELYNGATKKLSYQRRVLKGDRTSEEVTQTLHVRVVPGWEDGTVVTFPGMGDEGIDVEAPDVEVELQTAHSDAWDREGSTLYYTAHITLAEALCGTIIHVPTLDGRTLAVPMTQVVAPGVSKTVPGEGMPTEGGAKGELVIVFETSFPETLKADQKALIKKALA